MADGKTHFIAYRKGYWVFPCITFFVWISTAFYYWEPIEHVLRILEFASASYFLGRYICPDLDQAGTSSADGRMAKEIPGLGYVLYMYWTLYALTMSAAAKALGLSKGYLGAHRTILTHSYPGTMIRVYWFFQPLLPFLQYIMTVISVELMCEIVIGFSIAMLYSDSIHYRLDK